jgi:hypothetical protein
MSRVLPVIPANDALLCKCPGQSVLSNLGSLASYARNKHERFSETDITLRMSKKGGRLSRSYVGLVAV